MGHRHLFGTSEMFESGRVPNWNLLHTEHYANLARDGTTENGAFVYPGENLSLGVHGASHWNSAPSSSGYSSSHNVEVPHYQSDGSGPSYVPFLHPSNAGALYPVLENYVPHPAGSNYERQTFHDIDGGHLVNLTMGNGRGPHKRKSPEIPSVCERGSSSRYNGAGSSSELPITSEMWQEKPNMDTQHTPWDRVTLTPSYISNALSIRNEGSMRNVRSRPALHVEPNIAHLSTNPPHSTYSTDHSSSMDRSLLRSSALTREWPHDMYIPHGIIQVSGSDCHIIFTLSIGFFILFIKDSYSEFADALGFDLVTNDSIVGSIAANAPSEIGAFHHDLILGRNPIAPQSFSGTPNPSVRGVRSSYSQRSSPAFRDSSSALYMGHVGSSDAGMQLVAESYSSRHSRPLSATGWRHGDRSARSSMSNERQRSLPDEPSLHERFSSEGFMIVDRSSFYGSRSMLDQHRDLRLDIDNMTYEELLALGERMGSVGTGLSEDLISKCLAETKYCSADQMQQEENCVICLEEFKNMDDVGTLKSCVHVYHVTCIKKWLSIKNSCPICKASVMADHKKE